MSQIQTTRSTESLCHQIDDLGREIALLRGQEAFRAREVEELRTALGRCTSELTQSHEALERREHMIDSLVRQVAEDGGLRQGHEGALAESRARVQELERSNADLQQFACIASHDLQEPLGLVIGFLTLLEETVCERLDTDEARYLENAREGASRMQALIRGLLAWARAGGGERVSQRIDAGDALQMALANLEVALARSCASVTCDPLPEICMDEMQLIQIFQNLIGNAVKFRGEAPLTVHIGAVRREGEWLFSVRDNGVGVPGEESRRIFDLFHRARRGVAGTGFGLAICKRITERRGGKIWVESEPGQGATFCFTVPD